MRFRAKVTVVFLSTLITLYAIIGGFLSKSSEAVAHGSQYAQAAIFDEVLGHIIHDYVDEPDLEKVRIGSLRGLAEGLDPYSAYLTAPQLKQYDTTPSPGQTGMVVSKVNGFAYVVAVVKSSPADQAGIKDGDFIEYVGKIPSRDLSLYDVDHLIRGEPGTAVNLRIVHLGQSRKVTFNLGKVAQPAVEARTEESGIGYIKLLGLPTGRSNELKKAVSELTSRGAQKLVLDLRGSASGTLDEGVAVANLFVGSGTLAKVIGKEGKAIKEYSADPSKVAFTGPLTVVIDHSTAGPAELVAAAVRDQNRGDVVGEHTFGMGSEQKLFNLSDGGAFLITIAKYAPASGKPLVDEGIDPTVKVDQPIPQIDAVAPDGDDDDTPDDNSQQANPPKPEPTPAAPVEDLQLKKAIELLKGSQSKAAAQKRTASLTLPRRPAAGDLYERKRAA